MDEPRVVRTSSSQKADANKLDTSDESSFMESVVKARRRNHSPFYRPHCYRYVSVVRRASFLIVVFALLIQEHDGSSMPNHAGGFTTTPPSTPKLERGKPMGRVVTAKDLYRAYTEIQQDYREKAFGSSQNWKVLTQRDGVEIAMLQHQSDPLCPYIRMTAVMPTSVKDCWDFLSLSNWDKTMPKMDPFYEGLTVFGEYRVGGVHMLLARKRTKRILAFGKRDFVFISVSDVPKSDGTWVSGTVSVITPQLSRRKGYTRAYQDSIAFYKPLNGGKETHLTIVCRIDMNDHSEDGAGGAIPMWLYVKTIGITGAQSVLSMRHHLQLEMEERAKEQASRTQQRGNKLFAVPWMPKSKPEDEMWGGDEAFEMEPLEEPEMPPEEEEIPFWDKELPWAYKSQAEDEALEYDEWTEPEEPQGRLEKIFPWRKPRQDWRSQELSPMQRRVRNRPGPLSWKQNPFLIDQKVN